RFSHDARVCRFAAFSAEGDGRKIWAIGFHHELPKRDLCRDLSDRRAVFESDNSREGNKMVTIENFIRLLERAAETMEDTAQFSRVRFHDLKRVIPGVALMDNNVKPEFDGEIELLLKETCLSRLIGAILDARFDFFFSFALQGARENLHFVLLCRGHAG